MSISDHVDVRLAETVRDKLGISVNHCYQCGKCSAGCPASAEMDFAPSVVMRMLQTGTTNSDASILRSYAIWLCLACETCFTRCPMEIDLPRVMDVLRNESLKLKLVHPKARDIVSFHKSFIDTVRHFGRMWELGLIAEYKLRTRHFWQDVVLAPLMLRKGLLSLRPPFNKTLSERIFSNIKRQGDKPK